MTSRITQLLLRAEALLLGLALLTVMVMAWQHWGMDKTLVITPELGYKATAVADSAIGGNSTANLIDEHAYNLHCQLRKSIQYPYCQLVISLHKEFETGIDLTDFQSLNVTLSYTSNETNSLHIYLKSLPQKNSFESQTSQQSISMQAFNPSNKLEQYEFILSRFYVPSSWVYASNLPQEMTSPDLTQIDSLVITNGDSDKESISDLKVEKIEFKGKWIKAEALYRNLLWCWVAVFILIYTLRIMRLNKVARLQAHKSSELEKINQLLNTQSKRLEAIAIYDKLTGAYNREGMKDFLASHTANPKIKNFALLIEIDNIDKIEQKLNQQEFDELILNTFSIIKKNIKEGDAISRWDRAEFLLLIEVESSEDSEKIAQIIRAQIQTQSNSSTPITCSIGITDANLSNTNTLYENANTALLTARKMGRNSFFRIET